MAKLLRKVQRKTDWDPDGEFSSYLPAGHAPADALKDLATTNNNLSVWQVDDAGENLDRVLAAIVSTRQYLQVLDYLIIDSERIQALNLAVAQTPGDTHDVQANEAWHFHLTRLSATDVANLANTMLTHGETKRQRQKQLISLLKKSVEEGFVDRAKLGPDVSSKL
jgi:hypothetical protein